MGRTHEIDHAGLIDASAGYHARETAWRWSAGVGTATDGRARRVEPRHGVHDAPAQSERTVWIDGVAARGRAGDVHRRPRRRGVRRGDGGGELRFTAEAERARRDDLKLFVSDYRQPFGTFAGTLPGGVELAEGYGVMEWHDVRW